MNCFMVNFIDFIHSQPSEMLLGDLSFEFNDWFDVDTEETIDLNKNLNQNDNQIVDLIENEFKTFGDLQGYLLENY